MGTPSARFAITGSIVHGTTFSPRPWAWSTSSFEIGHDGDHHV
jgi:hypothetical protein